MMSWPQPAKSEWHVRHEPRSVICDRQAPTRHARSAHMQRWPFTEWLELENTSVEARQMQKALCERRGDELMSGLRLVGAAVYAIHVQ